VEIKPLNFYAMQIQIDLPQDAIMARVLAYLKRLKIPYTISESTSDDEMEALEDKGLYLAMQQSDPKDTVPLADVMAKLRAKAAGQ
jgi:hypothetical protein